MNFFTSDHHFGHYNIIKYCERPFKDVYHMNTTMINRWNEKISPDDVCYYLGDFSMKAAIVPGILSKLNGTKILLTGNHDRTATLNPKWVDFYIESGFKEVHQRLEMEIAGKLCLLNHYPYKADKNEKYHERRPVDTGQILIHGHCHSTPASKFRRTKSSIMVDIGVDGNDFYPYSIEDLAEAISNV